MSCASGQTIAGQAGATSVTTGLTDWGKLMIIQPRVPDAAPVTLLSGTAVRSGWWSPGPLRSGGQTAPISQLGGR